ncbi:hypothetical protein [Sphingobacterium sp. LRF_L2]|uniref:hypothetical protein n=1 Tax=Sphingobacterium sp. LRF_L2 TaxID=3369421 RepID=UPI003F63D7C8
MKKLNAIPYLLLLATITFITACNRPSPDQFFQTTILNTNILHEFASERFTKTLVESTIEFPDIPATKNKGDEAQQIVQTKTAYIEQTIKKIEDATPPDEDGETIKIKALELYNFVLPIYKKEYLDLALLCDKKSGDSEIAKASEKIIATYGPSFEQKYNTLLDLGKAYAEKHSLNVSFGN